MRNPLLFTVLLCCLLSLSKEVLSQTMIIPEERRMIYKKEWSGGATLSNRGFGGNLRFAVVPGTFKKLIFEADISKIKHPKEVKVINPYYDGAKSYVYGKENSFFTARIGAGTQFLIFDKAPKDGVEISFSILGGLSLGMLKPIYYEILKDNGNPYYLDLVSEKFDKDKHNVYNIYSYSGFNKGFNELSTIPGAYVKAGFNFDWSGKDDKILMLETGTVIDVFATRVPIMANFDNLKQKQAFISLYATILFGKKY